jgi:hypothetical protein
VSEQPHPDERKWTSSLALRVDEVCLRFEAAWKEGRRPRIEDELGRVPEADRAVVLCELVALELALRARAGEKPDPEEYRARFPGAVVSQPTRIDSAASLVEVLRRYELLNSTVLDQLDQFRVAHRTGPELARELLQRGWLTAYQAERILSDRGHELSLGQYVVLEPLREGGMGRVFKARQKRLGRMVAVKVIREDLATHPEALRRFQREILATARLAHPNVVYAHDAGRIGDTAFLVVEFVEGLDLERLSSSKCEPAALR